MHPVALPAVELAVATHVGDHGDIDVTYGEVGAWVVANVLGVNGPVRETYLVGPRDTPNRPLWRTEIGWPVFAVGGTGAEGTVPTRLVLDHHELQAVMRESRYASWRTALASVTGIYLITDTRDGRHNVGKADGVESIRQRWGIYAANGHGGNVELRGLDPATFRFSLLRVFDPATPTRDINAAESHLKHALDARRHGLNRN